MRHWRLAPPRGGGGKAWGAALASVLLHGGLALGLLVFVRVTLPSAPPEPLAIEVLVMAPAAAEPVTEAEAAPPTPEPPAAVAVAPEPIAEAKPVPPRRLVAPPKPARAAVAAPAGEPVAAPVPAAVPVDAGWRNSFATWLATHRVYPPAARRDGTEGRATIRVVIAQDGAVLEADMLAGTGSAVLDRAVAELLDAIRQARFPFPDGMAQARVAQTVTLRYALTP
jgi:protein TonB